MSTVTERIAATIDPTIVGEYMIVRMDSELIRDAIYAAAEQLEFVANEDHDGNMSEVDVHDALDAWRCEYNPSWTIYTSEIDEVICHAGVDEVLTAHRELFGEPSGAADMVCTLAYFLANAVTNAFHDIDWEEFDENV